jgi:hypothetical protein
MPLTPAVQARLDLVARLQARRGDIEQAVLTRVYAIADPTQAADPAYAEGLRAAVSAALDHGIVSIESGAKHIPQVPTPLLAQARLAARNRVSLDTVLRRYFAGYTVLGDFLVQEAAGSGLLRDSDLKSLLRAQATSLDEVLAAVSEEYAREADGQFETVEDRRGERVERLLAGELLDASELAYDLDLWHIGLVVSGAPAKAQVRQLADGLDRRLLAVCRDEGTTWAWLGGRRRIDPSELDLAISSAWPAESSVAIGEPGLGLAGWRLTHRQAAAALPIVLRSARSVVHYADVALLASICRDDLLAISLRSLYLTPLAEERDGGAALRETLRAYFAADRKVSSAAAALGVSRRTVFNRLRAIEERLGRSLSAFATQIEAALSLDEFAGPIPKGETAPLPPSQSGSPRSSDG